MGCSDIDVKKNWLQLHHEIETAGLLYLLRGDKPLACTVCMLQENLFKQGPAGISPQGTGTNHFSSPVTSAAGMT